ncbi:NAD(P)/FAD-dependent oxidoreductase [Roseateles saccharophilus]|uniref:Sulfide dehydrogenase (Flavocytochrome c) flavoprotein subunit n=1 Tax=Roseateles saccharophilus TaxID=304 RepID=A0A4R3VBP7_ROSSA|nr:NAD(P)/FAD-dependent oxidoreductase [Roseateles saccharophilus]MDG0831766.1 flavocytochrome C [Roseateles saccharophilus]TCV01213.1 sulfide dehydrogenase (flavocytochrome c) flavoprotein subunit [Roseateles saccharophilus]
MIARRELLAAGGLALAGCAGTPPGAVLGRVVVVGGGFGGATAARYLKLWGGAAVDVTLVERNEGFISCPMSNLVIGGVRDAFSISHGYAGLEAQGVKRVAAEVVGIDPARKTAALADGRRLGWDRLVLAPGIGFMLDEVPGLAAALDSGRAVHAWKAGLQTLLLRRQLQALPDAGVVLMSIPRAPYRCPPGPYERACLIAAYLRAAKPRAKLLVLDANPEIQSKRALFERAFAQHHAGVLEYRPNAELKEVTADGVARFEFEDVRADVLNLIPPQRAGELAAAFANVNRRWVGIDWLTMQAEGVPGVHVVGDAILSAPGTPKSGHLANQQAKLAAAAVLALLKGEAVNPAPLMMNTCYSFVTPTEAMHIASVHQYDAAEKTMKPVPGAGGLSPAANVAEAGLAHAWAENIWADTLALGPESGRSGV